MSINPLTVHTLRKTITFVLATKGNSLYRKVIISSVLLRNNGMQCHRLQYASYDFMDICNFKQEMPFMKYYPPGCLHVHFLCWG